MPRLGDLACPTFIRTDGNVTTDTEIITGPWALTFEGAAVP